MAKFVFLLGAHKSGTSLLRSLLDGHPSLEVVPIESHFFQFAGWPILYPYKQQTGSPFDFDDFRSRALKSIVEYNTSDEFTSDVNLANRFDVDTFKRGLGSAPAVLNEEFLLSYFNAIKISLGGPPLCRQKIIVEKSIENTEFAWAIERMLPEVKFIHIIRDPYSNFVSIRKFKTLSNRYPSLPEIIGCLNINYHFLELNANNLRNYLTIRFEDLVTRKEETLSKITSFLEIPVNVTLNTPTVMGKNWQGNSGKGKKMEAVEPGPVSHWKFDLKPIEIYYVNKYFSKVLDKYNYEKLLPKGNLLGRNKGESFKTYLRNRLYKIF